MQRAVANRPANVRIKLEDDAGTLVDVDAATNLAVTVKDLNGTTVAAGNAAHVDLGRYIFPILQPALNVLTASWTATVGGLVYTGMEFVRVVTARCVALSKLRKDSVLSSLDSWDFVEAVDTAEEALEEALRFRFVPVLDRVSLQITSPRRVIRPGPMFITSVLAGTRSLPGNPTVTTLDPAIIVPRADGLELPTGASWSFLTGGYWPDGNVFQTATWTPGVYTFDLIHGLASCPGDIQGAIQILARHNASLGSTNAYPDRATKIVSAETEIWLSRTSPDNYFGIPEVDSVVAARRQDLPIAGNPSF